MAEALYRKYRPQTFGDVVGQDHIEDTLKNAIQQDKVSHAYLFCGPRGTGKTTTARLLAKALLCRAGEGAITPNPDGTCEDCLLVAAGEHPDVYELDAASRTGVENVREEIIGRVQFAPTRGKYKVYIIDEVHMLSTAAFNALLKTLEEPPSHVVFVLATTDPQKVPETIHSRCQRFDFRRIGTEGMVARLGAVCAQEGVEFEGEALELIAHRAEGGMRNALTSLEQMIAFGKGKVTLEVAERMLGGIDSSDMAEIMDAVGRCDAAACFCWVASFVETGADLAQFAKDMAAHVRNLYVLSLAGASVALEVGETERAQLVKELPLFGPDRLSRMLSVLGDVCAELKTSTNPRLSFEIALTRMVRPESELTLEALAERIEKLERAGASGLVASVVASSAPIDSVASSSASVASAAVVADIAPASRIAPNIEPASSAEEAAGCASASQAAIGASPVVEAAPAFEPKPALEPMCETAAVSPSEPACGNASAPLREPERIAAPAIQSVAAPVSAPASNVLEASNVESAASPAGEGLSSDLVAAWQNPAALQRMWASVMAALKKNKAAYGVLFLNTKAVVDSAGKTLQIEFPAENAFVYKAVQKPEVQESVAAALQQVVGIPVPFSYVQRGSDAAASSASFVVAPSAAPSASPAPSFTPAPVTASVSAPQSNPAPAVAMRAVSAPEASTAPSGSAFAPAAPMPEPQREESRVSAPWEDAPEPEFVPLDAYDAPGAYDPSVDEPVPYTAPADYSANASGAVRKDSTGSRDLLPWEEAPASVPSASSKPDSEESSPAPSVPRVMPPEPVVDTHTSATLSEPKQTLDDIKSAITSVFGDGVVFQDIS